MPKSKSRNVTKCKDCFLCEKVIDIHIHNDISALLAEVKQWHIDDKNQYRNQYKNAFKYLTFECLVCCFKTIEFNEWKWHIMTISHLTECHRIKDLYSYVCSSHKCNILLYGPKKSLLAYQKCIHPEVRVISAISYLMAEVMRRYINKLKPLYYCSHCSKFAETPIHTNVEKFKIKRKTFIEYYCKFCKVTIFASPEMIDYHSLSMEHMTLKCFNKLCSTAEMNPKRIKLSEQSNQNSLLAVQNAHTTNSIELPIAQHKSELTDSNYTTIKYFKCHICVFVTNFISKHEKHITSFDHRTKCRHTYNYYSYFCEICNIFMYGNIFNIKNHWSLEHKYQIFKELPALTIFMKKVYKNFKTNPNRIEVIHYYGNNKLAEFSKTVSLQCHSCNIEFHTSLDDFNKHNITVEHIFFKFLCPKKYVIYKNNLKSKIETTKSIEITNVTLFKKHGYIKDSDHEQLQNAQVNKSQTNNNSITHMDNIKKTEKHLMNNVSLEEENYHVQNNSIKTNNCRNYTELTHNHISKPQYTKYFKHKMNILNLLKQFKDRIMNNLSYYCDVCDLMVEEKEVWDKHNHLKHKSTDKHIIYCSTCSMFIICENIENHNNTIEHCIILQLSQSLKPVEEGVMNKISLVKSVGNNTSDKMFINPQITKELGLNNTDGNPDYQNLDNNDYIITEEQIDNVENPAINSFLLMNNNEDQNEHSESNESVKAIKNGNGEDSATKNTFLSIMAKNQSLNEYERDEMNMTIPKFQEMKSTYIEITPTLNNSTSTLTAIPHKLNVDENIKENKNSVDLSMCIDDLSLNYPSIMYAKEDFLNKIELVQLIENSTLDKTTVNLGINEQLRLNNIDGSKEYQNSDNLCKIFDSLINEKQIDNVENPSPANSFLLLDENRKQNERGSDKTVTATSKNITTCNKITSTLNNKLFMLPNIPIDENVIEKKNCEDVSTFINDLNYVSLKSVEEISIDIGKSLDLSNIDNSKKYQNYPNNNGFSNNNYFLNEKPNNNDATTNIILLLNKNKCQNEHSSDTIVGFQAVKSTYIEITSKLNDVDKNIKENMNYINFSIPTKDLNYPPLIHIEKDLMNKIMLVKSVRQSISDEMSVDIRINQQFGLNNIVSSKEFVNYLKNYGCENKNSFINEKQYGKNVLSLDKNHGENEHGSDKIITTISKIFNLVTNDRTPTKIVNVKSNHEVVSYCSKPTSELGSSLTNVENIYNNNKIADEYNQDKAYGEYVTQRLQSIKNTTIKKSIKLEIDYLFYTKMKKLS